MRTLAKTALALSFIGAMPIGTVAPVKAQSFYFGVGNPYHHRHYYNYYGGGGHTWNGCRPGWTVQGGVCKPIAMVRGTSMGGGRAITDFNVCGGRAHAGYTQGAALQTAKPSAIRHPDGFAVCAGGVSIQDQQNQIRDQRDCGHPRDGKH